MNWPACAVEVCDRPAAVRGLCLAHYQRKGRGAPMGTPIRSWSKRSGVICRVQGCSGSVKAHGASGMCSVHYNRHLRGTALDAPVRRRVAAGALRHAGDD